MTTENRDIKPIEEFKVFDQYDVSQIAVKDPALKPHINLTPKLLIKSFGRRKEKFSIMKVNILERLANRLAVPGHIGKKHKIITSWSSGKYNKNMKIIINVLALIEKNTGKNPIQVLVDAIENCSPRDEITVIESAGARYPQAVDCSPSRRVNLAIRWLVQGAYTKSFGKKNKMITTLANEIILASKGSMDSYSLVKKNEAEKQADAAR
ncbi:30S ribosomal protein S7 [Candidatus Pacearchaeota archaeon]|nr:30S ribosomal protein S7 [Candidatus Pacearchaeota archaeon]